MEHTTIITAFENAGKRDSDKIYITFKRQDIFYKDTYLVLRGTKEEVEQAIQRCYTEVETEKRDYPRADHIDMLDTPFDTWCFMEANLCGESVCDNLQCRKSDELKCRSYWTHVEHATEEEMSEYINNIRSGYYPCCSVDNM